MVNGRDRIINNLPLHRSHHTNTQYSHACAPSRTSMRPILQSMHLGNGTWKEHGRNTEVWLCACGGVGGPTTAFIHVIR
jgi:hypothetical protein